MLPPAPVDSRSAVGEENPSPEIGAYRRLALTFDAEHPDRRQCPPGVAERMLAILDRERGPATFFLQGRWVTAYPQLAQAIVAAGHLVGNHSHSHAPLMDLSDAGLSADIAAGGEHEAVLADAADRLALAEAPDVTVRPAAVLDLVPP